jgi:hypothetical protein
METALQLEVPGITPARRRLCTINNRPQNIDPQKEWTAARCNRLLRALTSRIAILKKDISRLQSAVGSKGSTTEAKSSTGQKRWNTSSSDADWANSRKKIKRTYSARGGKANYECWASSDAKKLPFKGGKRLTPGEISVPTPVLNRARGEPLASPYPACAPVYEDIRNTDSKGKKRPRVRDRDAQFQLSLPMRGIREITPADRYSTYEGIYYGLEALLRVTACDEPEVKQHGPRSLMTLCLGAIPHYIAKEKTLLAAQLEETGGKLAIDRRDISTEIYDDLEAFGSMGRGWKHLRTVVRSHGIQVIGEAIKEGLLDVDFCGTLISLCVNMHATREAETLLSGLLSVGIFTGPKTVFTRFDDDIATRPLSMFWNFVIHRSCFSYQYRQLSNMIANGLLHISWLATKEFVTFWARAIQEFSQDLVDPEAIRFLNTVLPMLAMYGNLGHTCKRDSETADSILLEAVKQTFSSLIATLTAVVILSKETVAQTEESKVYLPDYSEVVTLFRACLTEWKLCNSFNINRTLLVLAVLVVGSYDEDSTDIDHVDALLNHLRHSKRSVRLSMHCNDLVVFVCSIARCCGRGASNSGFQYLQHLHMLLESFAHDGDLDGRRYVEEIIVDSAFAFARQVPDRRHLDYAASAEAKFQVMRPESIDILLSENPSNRDGFRWEEGISEWVTATPSVRSLKHNRVADYSVDDGECESPFYPSNRRSLSKYPGHSVLVTDLVLSSDFDIEHDYTDIDHHPAHSPSKSTGGSTEEDDITTTSPESERGSERHDFYESEDELILSMPQREVLEIDELSTPSTPSLSPGSSNAREKYRRYVDRAPRLSRRVLRHSLHWQLFDASEDELSSFSSTSQENLAWQESTSGTGADGNSQALSRGKGFTRRVKSTVEFEVSFHSDSEDELGI